MGRLDAHTAILTESVVACPEVSRSVLPTEYLVLLQPEAEYASRYAGFILATSRGSWTASMAARNGVKRRV